jgi:hypothetical protein
LSVLKRREAKPKSNRTQHGISRLTSISDAGSTPAASTNQHNIFLNRKIFGPAAKRAGTIGSNLLQHVSEWFGDITILALAVN